MRHLRLRQWLALLLRTLIILLIVSAFARPAYRDDESGLLGHVQPTAAVVLFDRSFSTMHRLPEGRVFDLLRLSAEQLAEFFGPRDRLFLVPFALKAEINEAVVEEANLPAALQQLTISEAATDIGNALLGAGELLTPIEGFNRELYLFTDLSAVDWNGQADLRRQLPDVRIFVVSPTADSRLNTYLRRFDIDSWMAVPGGKLEARFEIGSNSTILGEIVSIDLFVDDLRVGHRTLTQTTEGEIDGSIPFAPLRAGRLSGFIALEDDRLNLDNRRYLSFDVADSLRVRILGKRSDDSYYPRRGLAAAAIEDPALRVRSGLFADLDSDLLAACDVLLLCNLEYLDQETVTALHEFVARGGGLIVFPGPQADMNFFNRRLLPGLIPIAITGVTGDLLNKKGFQRLLSEGSHPLVDQLFPDLPADRPLFRVSYDLVPRGIVDPLIYFEEGQLAMVSAIKERGRAVLMSFPLSLEWNDFPLRGMFAPLLHRLVRSLGGVNVQKATYLVGQMVHRHLPDTSIESTVHAESPSGKRFLLEPRQRKGRLYWTIPDIPYSGIWRVYADGALVDEFAVNLDARESQLQAADRTTVKETLGPKRVHLLDIGQELKPVVMAQRHGRELWREFLGLAVLLLLLELWIARAPRSSPGNAPQESDPESISRRVSKV